MTDDGAPSESAIQDTALCLEHLATTPGAYALTEFRPVRAALHKLLQSGVLQGLGGVPSSASASSLSAQSSSFVTTPSIHEQIATALRLGDWQVAVSSLRELQQTGIIPKLGTLQRWVRECDGVFTDNLLDKGSLTCPLYPIPPIPLIHVPYTLYHLFLSYKGSLACLDAILRIADPASIGAIKHTYASPSPGPLSSSSLCGVSIELQKQLEGMVEHFPPWNPRPLCSIPLSNVIDEIDESAVISTLRAKKCAVIAAKNRIPPNQHSLTIWTTSDAPFHLVRSKSIVFN